MVTIERLFGEYLKKRRAETKAYEIICDLQASTHGYLFGHEARERLSALGLDGETLYKMQERYRKDPTETRESLVKSLLDS